MLGLVMAEALLEIDQTAPEGTLAQDLMHWFVKRRVLKLPDK